MYRKDLAHLAFAVAAVAAAASPAAAQQTIQGLPEASPHATIAQTVGISTLTIDYHRPAVAGREVWGALVPWDQVWRAGANDNTTIELSDPARIGGQTIPAGTYGLHMLPGRERWTVILSRNSTSWGSFSYDAAEDAVRLEVVAQPSEFDERLRYSFDDVDEGSAEVALHWADLRVPFRVEFDTPALIVEKIRRDLRHLPRFSWQGWNSAAAWTLRSGYALEEGLGWADRSIQMNQNGTNLMTKVGILQRLGRNAEASELEQRALAVASEAEINQLGYTYLLQLRDTDRAIALFRHNTEKHPESWNVWDSLGEGLAAKGDKAGAIANYSKALSMAPEDQRQRIEGVLANLRR
jgi:tetratricopeptide (TPR) repeat protein